MTARGCVVFAGRSISAEEVPSLLPGARVLPPAAHGDIVQAVTVEQPHAVVLLDGAHDRLPLVWHKELLWAMSLGVHVVGAAALGALRAAELAPFGMRGIGRVFEAYRDGFLDDDEVWTSPVSVAMVDVRATLHRASEEDVLDRERAEAVASLAKGLGWEHRTWGGVVAAAIGEGALHPDAAGAFARWVGAGAVRQQHSDAREALRAVHALVEADAGPFVAPFTFEPTDAWEQALGDLREAGAPS